MTKLTTIMKRFLVSIFVVAGALVLVTSSVAHAASNAPEKDGGQGGGDSCSARFLTFPTWYRGLTVRDADGNCEIMSPSKLPGATNDQKTGGLTKFVWTIVLNIIEIMLQLVGYAAVGFIIYGGIKYIYSAGSPTGMVSARKTIMNAVVGLVISLASVAIVNTIAGGL